MDAGFIFARLFRFLWICCFAGVFLILKTGLAAETAKPGFSWDLLWAGSWDGDGNQRGTAVNRGDLRLHIPWQNLSLRTQLIGKSKADLSLPLGEMWDLGTITGAGGIYHKPSGSRILYGTLEVWGLSARIRRPWGRAVPLVEYRKPSLGDLRTEPTATKEPEAYLYLRSPPLGIWRGFISAIMTPGLGNDDISFGLSGGIEAQWDKKRTLQVEGFYTGKELPPRYQESWFSPSPPLPEREFHLYALGLVYTGPFLGIASDWAYSDTFAYGRDLYGNLGVRLGNRPWRLSLAADGAGNRYVGSDGFAGGAGFRVGGRLEYYGKKGRFFRLGTSLEAGELGEPFEQSSTLIYYRFPSDFGMGPFKFSRISLKLTRDAEDLSPVEDCYEALVGLVWGSLRWAVSGSLTGISTTPEQPLPFPIPNPGLEVPTATISGEVSYRIGQVQFRVKLGYTGEKGKDEVYGIWNTSWYASIRGKLGRFSLKIASPDLPTSWTYTLTWRLEHRGNRNR
ncbi:MAG: hypothetical protein LBB80_06755 [Treponema sp.]|jgi:hypothetical protein|nr:hypothetical protein [Treponema sp.]